MSIWRVNTNDDEEGSAANVAWQFDVGFVPDPCSGDLDRPVLSSEVTTQGDETTDVGVRAVDGGSDNPQHFHVKDGAGNDALSDCFFTGAGFAPTASSGLVAGTLTCSGGTYSVDCVRPFDNLATTCGGQALSSCGTLGKGCAPYYQLLATCRI